MFEQVSHGSKSGTKKLLQMLPGLHSEDDGRCGFPPFAAPAHKAAEGIHGNAAEVRLLPAPTLPINALAAGKCEKACRAGALKLEDLPDGQTRIVITPWKCSECEVCVASCSNHGIDGMKLRQLTTLGPVSVHKCTKTLCKECGKPIAPGSVDGVCTVCRIKARTKKAAGRSRCQGKAAAGGAGSQKGCRGGRKGSGGSRCRCFCRDRCRPRGNRRGRCRACCGRFRHHSTDPGKKQPPAALDEAPAAAPENTAEKDVPDTPKND